MPTSSRRYVGRTLLDLQHAPELSSRANRFLAYVAEPLATVTLVDVQVYLASIEGATSTRAKAVAVIKSLLSFAHETGDLASDVGKVVKAPAMKNTLAERILLQTYVVPITALEHEPAESVIGKVEGNVMVWYALLRHLRPAAFMAHLSASKRR